MIGRSSWRAQDRDARSLLAYANGLPSLAADPAAFLLWQGVIALALAINYEHEACADILKRTG